MPDTTYADLRFPASTNVPNIPQDIQNLASDLDQKVIVRVANPTARTALTAYAGMLIYEISSGRFYRRNTANTAWDYAGGNPPPAVACPLIAGWSATSGNPPGVYKDASGLVHFIGSITPQTAYNPQDGAPHTCLTVPVGYRPAADVIVTFAVPNDSTVVMARVGFADGVVNIISGTTSAVRANIQHHLTSATPYHPTYNNTLPFA